MQHDPRYGDVVREVRDFLAERAEHAIAEGVEPEKIIVDPGIGFGKTLDHNLALLYHLDELVELGFPVLVGTSRKSFIGRITGVEETRDRVFGTVAANVIAYERGATLFRVHDVQANREALAVAQAIRRA
jgi:dihydropteroate synthase